MARVPSHGLRPLVEKPIRRRMIRPRLERPGHDVEPVGPHGGDLVLDNGIDRRGTGDAAPPGQDLALSRAPLRAQLAGHHRGADRIGGHNAAGPGAGRR
jgi:hypothetical protein